MTIDPLTADRVSQLLSRLDVPGPRYTSYPTADRFVETFDAANYRRALQQRASETAAGGAAPLSVYVHIPFCESICYYCACNKVVTRQHERAGDYLQALRHEIELHVAVLGQGQPLSQLHFGGGSPTFLDDQELEQLMAVLRAAFRIVPQAEVSIEVDPRTVDEARLRHLAALGFNRLSFGVQDFDPEVQKAVHREQPYEAVEALMRVAREIGFESINADLIYGLPRQTPATFSNTIAQMAALRPDRIALYAYAHLPARFKPQRRIHAHELPAAGERVHMLRAAISGFQGLGYTHIGMDHFALPGDPLAVARREGRLHRNFQGYSTQADCDLIGLGVSAIGKIGRCYSQNDKTLSAYYDAIGQSRFASVRGLELSDDDLLCREVIMALMCQGRLDFDAVERAHPVRVREYFAAELERLRPLQAQGLVALEPTAIEVTPLGWYFVRAIAMVFDRHLASEARRDPALPGYSRVV
ncbi:MAG: oxygen-independent coproporphyrinogen III oxidase [Burkholderiales bacterium PBB1]|nr:MAG: oxygen-independent coproporphyrinogen III oxidase [Burkholderiales bacterium PBB1]